MGRWRRGVGVKIWPDRWLERVRKLKVKSELEEDKKGKTACGLGGEGVGNSVVGWEADCFDIFCSQKGPLGFFLFVFSACTDLRRRRTKKFSGTEAEMKDKAE